MSKQAEYAASKSLLDFLHDFTKLTEAQIVSVRKIMEQAVGELMDGAMNLSVAKDDSVQKVERLSRDTVGGNIAKNMEALGMLDETVQQQVVKLIGVVSVEDVIHQRLSHIVFSVGQLNQLISGLISNFDQGLSPGAVKTFKNQVLTGVYKAYTTTEEREIFHDHFGRPVSKTG